MFLADLFFLVEGDRLDEVTDCLVVFLGLLEILLFRHQITTVALISNLTNTTSHHLRTLGLLI